MKTAQAQAAPPVRQLAIAAGEAAEYRAADAYNAGDYRGAIEHFLEARRLGRSRGMLHSGLGTCYMFTGREVEAIAEYRHAIRLGHREPKLVGNLIFLLDHQPETTLETAVEARKAWWRAFGAPLRATWRGHANDPDPERPLRIGYVSGDFRRHSAAIAFAPVVLRHSEGYQPVCYYNHTEPDNVTENFIDGSEFYDVAPLDDPTLAAKIRDDRIDILIDLSGFSARNRLELFCRRPAPVQATGWGYATGTGLPVFDGFFADEFVVPRDLVARGYVEPLLYLPCVVPFAPMPYTDPVGPLPALANGTFTFGSFNRWAKVTPTVLATWAEILARTPGSRLLLKEKAYEWPEIRNQVLAAMAERGVDPLRIIFRGFTDHVQHLASYHDVDLALDPFPHSGGITALEGLWAGVPPVTLIGERVPERLSASICSVLNLKAFITETRAEYVEAAVLLATKFTAQLGQIRSSLQHRMAASPLCSGYAQAVETHYRELWRAWCRRQGRLTPGG
jgi:predicted O-linked N-acetylglucosamine transferase (SPINDLY family)